MIIRIFDKLIRELYRAMHPYLWHKRLQINGIPRIERADRLTIGKDVSINGGCFLQCKGGINIGDRVTLSRNAKIFTESLDVENYLNDSQARFRRHLSKEVTIGEGVWIAANVTVLPGVRIAAKSIVAAGSVVSNSLEIEGCLYGGVPAKYIRALDANQDGKGR